LEIIVVDDASSDGTADVLRGDTDLRVIRLERQRGASAARNVGIQTSRGGYIAFQDDDDEWLPGKLRLQVAAFARHPEAGLVYGQILIRRGGAECLWPDPASAPSGVVFLPLLMRCFCAHPPGVLVRREAFDRVGYFDEQLTCSEDYDMWLRIASQFPFQFVAGPVAVHHTSADGLYYRSIARGSGQDDARKVVYRALQTLPQGRRYDEIRREMCLHLELQIGLNRNRFASPEERWSEVLSILRRYPDILQYRWGRGDLAMTAYELVMPSCDPIATGRALCRQLAAAARPRGLRARWKASLAISALWAEAAAGLGSRKTRHARAAGWAAAWAILHNPAKIRITVLLRLILRAIFGAGEEAGRAKVTGI
jgi:glycosyltransferase involved in cell wall biosynthesis